MKKNLLVILALLISSVSHAQDPKAKAILDAVSANLKNLKSLKANFSLGISKTKETRAGILNMKGLRYNITTGSSEIICDAKTIYTYQKNAKEVTINDIDPNENSLSPTKLFTNFYEKEYKSRLISEKKVGASTIAIIELIPLKAKQFTKVELTVDRVKNIIVGGKIFEKNGNILTYTISNYLANPQLNDALFIWNAKNYPGCEIIDLR